MTKHSKEEKIPFGLDRREFIKWTSALGLSAGAFGTMPHVMSMVDKKTRPYVVADKVIRAGCPAHNCGGRCVLKLHVKDEKLVRIETDDRPKDTIANPQLRACIRGRAYMRRQYHPDRLKYPMIRTGKRGEGKFRRASWEEALDKVASEIKRIKNQYGNQALYVPYGTGSYNQLNGRQTASRLFNLIGGSLGFYNSYSWAAISKATPYVFGTSVTGNQRQDWVNSKYILMWSWNPSEMRDGTNSEYFLKKAKENGAKIVCIDPRMSLSAVSLADEWIPIRPGTDVAMMSAMAYVMITEGLYDKDFVDNYCVGFDRSQMPEGAEDAESYKDYILGKKDGQPKTPEWAEQITTISKETIIRLAREYASTKPAMLYQGYGMQRRAYGETAVIGGCVLAAMTGNIGISGGCASGLALQADDGGPFWNVFPTGSNPVKARIPTFLWTEAVLRGKEMTAEEGVTGVDKLESNIKLIYGVATNALINQHANVNRTAKILEDESKVEFIVIHDQFMTPTAKFADVVLPACTQMEMWGLEDGWKYGDEVILMPRALEKPHETKSDYQICAEVAERFGVKEEYTQGRSEKEWIEWALGVYRDTRFPEVPSLEKFRKGNKGVYAKPITKPKIAFDDFRRNPDKNKLNTPSGKIEIFSKRLYDMHDPKYIPPVPKYIEEWESPFGKEAKKYPFQVIGHHYMARVHSTHDNNDYTNEAFPQRVFINELDAKEKGLQSGNMVKVYNDRGTIVMPCRVTNKILPGVVDLPQGAWWTPDENGIDRRGNVNVLTSHKWTPLAFGNAQHTIMANIEKAEEA
ncbi:MAG: molybdopterin-dependent oxidoreductase [Bacteroidales bacterium]|nr:molybdopterin-dependent oxidoreductase [Bacteroidales bacterium]MCF8337276.1 molybdopterin-dependent oxidoreductase [Bacteroidales bacterium]